MSSPHSWSLSLGLLAAVGCVAEPGISTQEAAINLCDNNVWGCGANSPEIDHYGFHDLNLIGQPNTSNITIETSNGAAILRKNSRIYELQVRDSRIYGFSPGLVPLSGAALVGAEIPLLINGMKDYTIRIENVRPITYPYPYGSTDTLEAYALSWYGPNNQPDGKRLVCADSPKAAVAGPAPRRSAIGASISRPPVLDPDLLNLRQRETIVFEGDRIDAIAKTMSDAPDKDWFNLGCAGHTLAKLHLMRHTIAANSTAFDVDSKDRQAALKLLSADYCGEGYSFTQAGVPLVWQGDLMHYRSTPTRLEARWTEQGAACLNHPRLASNPDIMKAIDERCKLPACTDLDPMSFDGTLRVSAIP